MENEKINYSEFDLIEDIKNETEHKEQAPDPEKKDEGIVRFSFDDIESGSKAVKKENKAGETETDKKKSIFDPA